MKTKKSTVLFHFGSAALFAIPVMLALTSTSVRADDDMMGSMPQQQPANTSPMKNDASDTMGMDHDHDQMKQDHEQMKKDHMKMMKKDKKASGENKPPMQNSQKMGKKKDKQMPMKNPDSGMMDDNSMGSGKSNGSGGGMDHM